MSEFKIGEIVEFKIGDWVTPICGGPAAMVVDFPLLCSRAVILVALPPRPPCALSAGRGPIELSLPSAGCRLAMKDERPT
jgi:hypothetical protein